MNQVDSNFLKTLKNPPKQDGQQLYIDAGVGHLRLRTVTADGITITDEVLPSNRDLKTLFAEHQIHARFGDHAQAPIFITGKLGPMVCQALGNGYTLLQAAAQWLAARDLVRARASNGSSPSLAMVEISASGYTLIGVDSEGQLKDDLLVLNPRCGAGTGVNLDRVLQKLGIKREQVDEVLTDYLGKAGKEKRNKMTTRADRCGVFAASATISDKNQGIPLAVALATTLKSETMKVCRKLPEGFDHVVMSGRFFNWQFVRECAEDYLHSIGVKTVDYDPDNTLVLDALHSLVTQVGPEALTQPDLSLIRQNQCNEFPSFKELKQKYEAPGDRRYHRVEAAEGSISIAPPSDLADRPIHIGLDVGSTMAKVVMADDEGNPLFIEAYSNAGDTISTVKRIFADLQERGISHLTLRSIGVTGSARYQVREALSRIYPELGSRIAVLVENYAHARGSIDQAREHLSNLKASGIQGLNEDFCVLVDIGGEDTKISTLALKEAELFNNAMNVKCSAGTGSLMDTLSALFGIPGAAQAGQASMAAPKSYEINATCAVFLMENAQKLQAQGVAREEILASANWAIVENMARTLWSQIELPPNTIVLLHGQTMLSDPLPLAVTHRLQDHLGASAFGLVPPYPGHRACIGLIRTMLKSSPEGAQPLNFSAFLESQFQKRIIQCQGAACDDPEAVCNRTSLKCQGSDGKQFTFTLGGCTAINELFAKAKDRKSGKVIGITPVPVKDTYKEIWDFIDQHHPKSDDPNRLIIPRSFVVSEWAQFLAHIFLELGIPVHVDNVRDKDLNAAQPQFDVDSCAPHMGAVGQFSRIAGEAHGFILAPQIEKLSTDNKSMGRTCTLNQGGFAVARGLAQSAYPDARIHLFNLDLSRLEAEVICDQIFNRLGPIFQHYGISPDHDDLTKAIGKALEARLTLRHQVAELAADLIEETHAAGHQIALVVGREYLLNPGIYDSHVRRLLRDKNMAAIPSYVLDVDLDESFGHIYWRNPHLISTILHAVAEKNLHTRIRQPRLAKIFQKLEEGEDLLPIVQISTFCCGPDSVTLPLAAELMKKRPFLLIQSDAIIKELAHLENRVNTYVRQLELGLHSKLKLGQDNTIEIRALDQLENDRPLDQKQDVIYFPTLSDNRVLTSVLRGAGFTCIDNYTEDFDLQNNIKQGRQKVGDSVCAPMAGVYSDLMRANEDFAQRRAQNDPLVEGKTRLLFFDNAGSGPCRQGQYVEVHKLSAWQDGVALSSPMGPKNSQTSDSCPSSAETVMRFLVAKETDGYNIGLEEWTLLRMYQGSILHGVLHDILFTGATACRDAAEYRRFHAEYIQMKEEVFAALAAFEGPGKFGQMCSALPGALGATAKYFAYRLDGSDIIGPIRRFTQRWPADKYSNGSKPISIHITGEVYMRVAQAEEIFRNLLATLGFGRFHLETAPVWGYLDYLLEEAAEEAQENMETLNTAISRSSEAEPLRQQLRQAQAKSSRTAQLRWILRNLVARPLYKAAGIPMPRAARETMDVAKEVLPTLRPIGELGPYTGEILLGLREGGSLFLNVAPTGCMVSTMGQVISPHLRQVAGAQHKGGVQHLFSADGEVNGEILSMAVLKSLGPEQFLVHGGKQATTV